AGRADIAVALRTTAQTRKGTALPAPPAGAAPAAADTHRPIRPTAWPRARDPRVEADRGASVLLQGWPVSAVERAPSAALRSACANRRPADALWLHRAAPDRSVPLPGLSRPWLA